MGEEQPKVMNETSTNPNSQIYLKMNPVDYNTSQITLEDIAKKLEENSEIAIKILEKVLNTDETTKRIENTLDAINKKISELSNQIMGLQSFTERFIEKAITEEDVDRIIETFTDECADKLVQHVNTTKQDYIYNTEQKKLMFSLGENAWDKLSEESKTFLITSKVTYNNMINIDSIIDYSGICVLVTKALEVETKKRFFSNFLNYLNKQYNEDYSKYHTALLYKNEKPLFIEKFNMGDIAFVMCYKENWYDTEDQKINNKSKLIEYCKSCVFSKYEENEIESLLTKYASSIEEIRKKFRNPSAHTNKIQRTDADECFDLILDVEKLLKQMLDSFDF